MSKQKILLTGAAGMLGSHLLKRVCAMERFEVFTIGRSSTSNGRNFISCDLTCLEQFDSIIEQLRPNYVIHCAANVNVNACEKDQENTYKLHVGTSSIIASKPFIAKQIYISTDSVFDGTKGDYFAGDEKNPLNYYALTKSLGEDEFIKSKQNAIIIRTNIIGYTIPFKNSLFEWAYSSLKSGKAISGFSNIMFNPLYVKTLARLIVDVVLLNEIKKGVYHFGSSGYLSKYDFVQLVAQTFEFDSSLILPVSADREINGVKRPMNTTLNIEETQNELGITFPGIEQELISISTDLKYA